MHEEYAERLLFTVPLDSWWYLIAAACWFTFASPRAWVVVTIVGVWLHFSRFPFADNRLQIVFWANVLGLAVCWRGMLDRRGRAVGVGRFVTSTVVGFQSDYYLTSQILLVIGVWCVIYGTHFATDNRPDLIATPSCKGAARK